MALPALLLATTLLALGQPASAATPAVGQRALAAVPGAPTLDELDPADREIQVN